MLVVLGGGGGLRNSRNADGTTTSDDPLVAAFFHSRRRRRETSTGLCPARSAQKRTGRKSDLDGACTIKTEHGRPAGVNILYRYYCFQLTYDFRFRGLGVRHGHGHHENFLQVVDHFAGRDGCLLDAWRTVCGYGSGSVVRADDG